MKALHVTENATYRHPFGAAALGSSVTLRLDIWDGAAKDCQLRLWQEGQGETLVPMKGSFTVAPDDSNLPCRRYTATINPQHLGVLWYCFKITGEDGSVQWYGAEQGWTTGAGCLYSWQPPSFQITVFEARQQQPDWFREGVAYQIFPDRFSRGNDWPRRAEEALRTPRKGPRRVLVQDWNQQPFYQREENGDVAQWDFYGGSFDGIRQRLGYLQDLGVTILYLNPIFEAASNHRYDTADYTKIDPMLGTLEDFTALCEDAKAHGISIILDGVFNHAGQDSVYFNAYGNYQEVGAIQDPSSAYRDWFHINEDGSYGSWWGIKDLPEYNEDAPSLRHYFCGEDGIIRQWLRAGARGWRLDVADELPDSFIEDIKAAAVAENPEALVLGEVWEDASNKYAYGQLRHYFQGKELDGVMNYPFRTAMIKYLTGDIPAPVAARQMQQLAENYPADNLACNLNLLGSHDRERILTMLGGAPAASQLTDAQRKAYVLPNHLRTLAKNRLKLATLLQMTMPGVPSIYYGDEAGMEGYTDPYNRACMPWDQGDADCLAMHRSAITLRKSLPLFTTGSFEPVSFGNEVLGWWRRGTGELSGHAACVLVNRSPWEHVTLTVAAEGPCVSELGRAQSATITWRDVVEDDSDKSHLYANLGKHAAQDVPIRGKHAAMDEEPEPKEEPRIVRKGFVTITLAPFETSVLYFHPQERMQAPLEPGHGVIAHITSLPTPQGPGTLGEPALRFVDWLAERGCSYWQMLPVNPTDEYGSPYAGLSAFAGNPNLIYYPNLYQVLKSERDHLKEAFLLELAQGPLYEDFCRNNSHWLEPYSCFCALKGKLGEKPWQQWPMPYRQWPGSPDAWPELERAREIVRREQFAFHVQWQELRDYANSMGVRIIGDMPMYVSSDSADVWSNSSQFALDSAGYPSLLAGCPPDDFAAEGQIWGNPTYRWDAMARDGYYWWTQRLSRMFELYDFVRLDHFLGFSSYYTIPDGKTALEGTWKYGPGEAFFRHLHQVFGRDLPIIGENLGTITPAVRNLVARTGFPGMDVLQFSDTDPRTSYQPAPQSLVYLSTHDTSTLVGWCQAHYNLDRQQAQHQAHQLKESVLKLVDAEGRVVMMQLQDVLNLGDEARMNVPGVAEGNWSWQATYPL